MLYLYGGFLGHQGTPVIIQLWRQHQIWGSSTIDQAIFWTINMGPNMIPPYFAMVYIDGNPHIFPFLMSILCISHIYIYIYIYIYTYIYIYIHSHIFPDWSIFFSSGWYHHLGKSPQRISESPCRPWASPGSRRDPPGQPPGSCAPPTWRPGVTPGENWGKVGENAGWWFFFGAVLVEIGWLGKCWWWFMGCWDWLRFVVTGWSLVDELRLESLERRASHKHKIDMGSNKEIRQDTAGHQLWGLELGEQIPY